MTPEDIHKALEVVLDPEIRRPITELDMVRGVELTPTGGAIITIALTIAGCPMKGRISEDVAAAARKARAIDVQVDLRVRTEEDRGILWKKLRGGIEEPVMPFSESGYVTRVFAGASGKGGVGKSSV